MPLYYRDSISFGPFRINLSKSGLGMSVGGKGLRFGTGPRGHYVHAGLNGIYYRKTLAGIGKSRSKSEGGAATTSLTDPHTSEPSYRTPDGVVMRRIISSRAEELRSGTRDDTISDLNEARQRMALTIPVLLVGGVSVLTAIAMQAEVAALVSAGITALGFMLASRADSARLNIVLAYELDEEAKRNFQSLVDAVDRLGRSDGLWYVEAAGSINNLTAWKRNSGASELIEKHETSVKYDRPPGVQSNITPPCIAIDGKTLHFMPDCVLVREGRTYGSVSYEDLRVATRPSRFIVDDAVPKDAEVVGSTWKHPNKSGGPDRRFNDNRMLPICLFSELGIVSSKGLKALVMASARGAVSELEACLNLMARTTSEDQQPDRILIGHED